MFDAVRNNQKIVQIFLALITLPFALWGIDAYVRDGGASARDVAKVGNIKISVQQFEQALGEQQDQLRRRFGESFQPEMMNLPAVRMGVLNSLIDQHILLLEAQKRKLLVTDNALREAILAFPFPDFQEDGRFSMDKYESALRRQGYSRPQFEAKFRQDLMMQQLLGIARDTNFISREQVDAMLRLKLEERSFVEHRIPASQFSEKVKIEADAIQKYYEGNRSYFETPERLKAQYVVLSLDNIMAETTVDEAELKAFYDSQKEARYYRQEERRVSHILINFKEDKNAAKAKAEKILKDVERNPEKFADFARQYSEDTGSSKNGGDLGLSPKGTMGQSLEDWIFTHKEKEISGVIPSEFGFHILKLDDIKPQHVQALSEVRTELLAELKRQKALRKFAEMAEAFTNMVDDQPDSLEPVAERFKLNLQETGWLSRTAEPNAKDLINSPKILSALFSDEVLKEKRNTRAQEAAPNILISARVREYEPTAVKPFETVRAEIEKHLKSIEIMRMAKKTGEERLQDLQKGERDSVSWSATKTVSRVNPGELPPAAQSQIFRVDPEKLPAYVGAETPNAYVLYKIQKVALPEKITDANQRIMQTEYADILSQEEFLAYMTALRARYKVEINQANLLENKDR